MRTEGWTRTSDMCMGGLPSSDSSPKSLYPLCYDTIICLKLNSSFIPRLSSYREHNSEKCCGTRSLGSWSSDHSCFCSWLNDLSLPDVKHRNVHCHSSLFPLNYFSCCAWRALSQWQGWAGGSCSSHPGWLKCHWLILLIICKRFIISCIMFCCSHAWVL